MSNRQLHAKITDEHRQRKAIVYLRQSSLKQVSENEESQRLQYAMKDRAQALGFQEVEVIDCDLGFSASLGARERKGFDYVISAVACGEIGIVLSRELSRLSRTDKDWCHLLEVCQIFGTLLADEEQVYDLNLLNDQLMLGIKGTLSVVELKVLRMRLLQGQEEKARRGELFKRLPVGYEARRAFEQYNEVDARNRLVAAELERRWNAKLEEIEKIKVTLAELEQQAPSLSVEDRERILAMGQNFKEVWEGKSCRVQFRRDVPSGGITHNLAPEAVPLI